MFHPLFFYLQVSCDAAVIEPPPSTRPRHHLHAIHNGTNETTTTTTTKKEKEEAVRKRGDETLQFVGSRLVPSQPENEESTVVAVVAASLTTFVLPRLATHRGQSTKSREGREFVHRDKWFPSQTDRVDRQTYDYSPSSSLLSSSSSLERLLWVPPCPPLGRPIPCTPSNQGDDDTGDGGCHLCRHSS